MDITQLKDWVVKNTADERTIKGFWKNYENYKHEDPKEFANVFGDINSSDLVIQVIRVSLNLTNWPECTHNTVSCRIPIVYKNKELGYYELIFTVNGEVEDDYFVIY
ncbi:MAG: hypothetical protein FIA99_05685 [Ruminiclostridium sp.]|nr:hypothetical protein [Ruminiclostridium sp.]